MLTMFILIGQRNAINGSHLYLTTGTADLKEDHQGHRSPMILTTRRESARQENGISVMSRSKLLNTSRELCCGQTLCQMEAQFHSRTHHKQTISLLQASQEPQCINSSSSVCLLLIPPWEQIILVLPVKDTTRFNESTGTVGTARVMAFQDLTSIRSRRVTG